MKRFFVIAALLLLTTPSVARAATGMIVVPPDENSDTDGDGLLDATEDSNLNGVVDPGETNPMKADTDGGGEADGAEEDAGRSPLDPMDDLTADSDGDGIPNGQETRFGTDPQRADTDDDGFTDGEDVEQHTDPLRADTDQDGIADGSEGEQGLDPLQTDTDKDGAADGTDPFPRDSGYTADTDKDGMPDEWEQVHGLTPADGGADAGEDPDGDGLASLQEFLIGTDPQNPDTDRDGTADGIEIERKTNPLENPCLSYDAPVLPFDDLGNHWSKAYVGRLQRIRILPDKDRIVGGYNDGARRFFSPEKPVSRFEFLKMVLMTNCIPLHSADTRSSSTFSDIPTEPVPGETDDQTQRRQIVTAALREGIIEGYPDGTFRPDAPVTRGEALKILLTTAQLPVPQSVETMSFPDVPQGVWFTPLVESGIALELVRGYPDGTFRPGASITRAEAAKIVLLTLLRNPRVNGYVVPGEGLEDH